MYALGRCLPRRLLACQAWLLSHWGVKTESKQWTSSCRVLNWSSVCQIQFADSSSSCARLNRNSLTIVIYKLTYWSCDLTEVSLSDCYCVIIIIPQRNAVSQHISECCYAIFDVFFQYWLIGDTTGTSQLFCFHSMSSFRIVKKKNVWSTADESLSIQSNVASFA